jgi:hypothetical protein
MPTIESNIYKTLSAEAVNAKAQYLADAVNPIQFFIMIGGGDSYTKAQPPKRPKRQEPKTMMARICARKQ